MRARAYLSHARLQQAVGYPPPSGTPQSLPLSAPRAEELERSIQEKSESRAGQWSGGGALVRLFYFQVEFNRRRYWAVGA